MEPVRIRTATLDDAAAILELEALFPSDRMSARSVRRFVTTPTAHVWVALQAHRQILGNLVLLLRTNSRSARIYSVVVHPQARGLGLGHRLVEAAERHARKTGREQVSLEVRADNVAARALYDKRGYVVERELPGFYEDGADGLRLVRVFKRIRP